MKLVKFLCDLYLSKSMHFNLSLSCSDLCDSGYYFLLIACQTFDWIIVDWIALICFFIYSHSLLISDNFDIVLLRFKQILLCD